MVLSDQQLRQELINYGEVVPPITQRNREQLRTRLEALQSQKQTRSAASPSRSRTAASPSRSRATASPTRTRATASPSRSHTTSSPTRTRATASPSTSRVSGSPARTRAAASPAGTRAAAASPSRTRSSATTTTGGSGRTTRTKQTPNLIELSDSEAESSSNGVLMSRSVRSGQTAPNVQKRSIALRSQHDSPTSLSSSIGPGNVTTDVEQSIARHRREIKQLLDSARDRNHPTGTSTSSSHPGQHGRSGKSSRSSSPSSKLKSRSRQQSSNSDDDTKSKSSTKSNKAEQKKSSALKRIAKPIQSCWKNWVKFLTTLFKILITSAVLIAGITFLVLKGGDLLPRQQAIKCSVLNATQCEDMKPVIAAVRKQLQTRTGEVDCGFRNKSDVLVKKDEIERYLDEKGLKFDLGNQERWNALVAYILDKPIEDILIWNATDQQTKERSEAQKLSTKEAVRSLTCRARQDINKTLRNLLLVILGSTGLLTLAWYLQRKSKTHEENEENEESFHDYLNKAKKLIQEQYEKHVKDPNAQPWLVINQIRDKLIPEHDQERLKSIWERVKNEISKQDSRIRSELQDIDGKRADVWRWIKSAASSPKKPKSASKTSNDETDDNIPSDVGLTECLKIRNCFRSDNYADDEEIDHVVDSIQNRCASVKRIEHIGIHSVFVYLKFSSKEAAAQGYHLLNNWNYQGRDINVKYIRLNRYYEHFPEAQDVSTNN